MKSVGIITGSELRQVQGVNYFIKSFIECNKYFKSCKVRHVYSSLQILNIDDGDTMPIGEDIGTKEYAIRTGIRTFLRKVLTAKFSPFALLRYKINDYTITHHAIKNYLNSNNKHDYLLFQEIGCAEYYFKCIERLKPSYVPKTALIIHSEDDSGSMLIDQFKGRTRDYMVKSFNKRRDYVYDRIDKVIYISKKAYNKSILPEEKRFLVYNGSPNIEYSFKDGHSDTIQFVCVGSFSGRKGQDLIVEAMSLMDHKYLSRMHMTFVGDGPELDNVKRLAIKHTLSENITFVGRSNNVSEILKDKDVFIMPSSIEGLPMSAIEAMRAGLFLILTDTGGNVELCNDNCGFVCTRELEDIKSKVYRVLDDEIISINQKYHSRSRFLSEFSLESMAQKYELMLNTLD